MAKLPLVTLVLFSLCAIGVLGDDYGSFFEKVKNYPYESNVAVPMRGLVQSWNNWYHYNHVIKPQKAGGVGVMMPTGKYTWTHCSSTDCDFICECFEDNDCKKNGNNGNGNEWRCELDQCCGTSCEKHKP